MYAFSSSLLAGVVISFAGADAMARDSAPMPRDAAIATLVASYSDGDCPQLKEKLKITQAECSARNEKAKQACPTLIASGLPDRLDQRQVSIVVARAMGCHSMMMVGQPYDNAPFDRMGENAFKEQGGAG